MDVTVALREGSSSWSKAENAGLKVASVSDAVSDADLVMILAPDEFQQGLYESEIKSNLKPTLIHFEELNRASQHVRNAALQILLEREIGTEFKFNENVLMMCSGNLGEEDNTDVEELDSALNNRLIHVNHKLSVEEWIDGFARENVHPTIVDYIETHPEQIYKTSENTDAYATPRSWTFLSDFIVENFGKDSKPSDFLPTVKEVAMSYVICLNHTS